MIFIFVFFSIIFKINKIYKYNHASIISKINKIIKASIKVLYNFFKLMVFYVEKWN